MKFLFRDHEASEAQQLYHRGADRAEALQAFREMAEPAAKDGLVPCVVRRKGEYLVYLLPAAAGTKPRFTLGLVLFALTFVTTTLAGTFLTYGYFVAGEAGLLAQLTDAANLGRSILYYSVPLVGILALHEYAHVLVARREHRSLTLPYFLPAPPLLSLTGTLGAVMGLRERMPNRRSLLELGASGPLLGFAASLVVIVIGLLLTPLQPAAPSPPAGGDTTAVAIQTPLVYDALARLLGVGADAAVHPVAIAGWFGLLLTSIQLLPIGPLDGGHIVQALAGRRAWIVSLVAALGLFILGFWYPGWFVLGALAVLLAVLMGLSQPAPLDDVTALPASHWALAVGCAFVFALSFVVSPIVLL